MGRSIGLVSFVVRDYDEALTFFVGALGFEVIADIRLSPDKRWVEVAPSRFSATRLLLARAATARQMRAVGEQAGGRVFLFLETDDFDRDYAAYTSSGVQFAEQPREEPYGRVAVFVDLYGNRWDLIERKRSLTENV